MYILVWGNTESTKNTTIYTDVLCIALPREVCTCNVIEDIQRVTLIPQRIHFVNVKAVPYHDKNPYDTLMD